MKKILFVLSILLIVGCSESKEKKEYTYSYFRFDSEIYDKGIKKIINTKDELENLKNDKLSVEVLKLFNKYDNDYFEKKSLVYIYVSSNMINEFQNVIIDNDIDIYFNSSDFLLDVSPPSNLLVIEVEKINKDIILHFNNERTLITTCNFNRTYKFIKTEVANEEYDNYYFEYDKKQVIFYVKRNIYNALYRYKENLISNMYYKFTFTNNSNINFIPENVTNEWLYDNLYPISIIISNDIVNENICIPKKAKINELLLTEENYEFYEDKENIYYSEYPFPRIVNIDNIDYDIKEALKNNYISLKSLYYRYKIKSR